MIYNKPAIEINEQISKLRNRGLIIEDESEAEYYLSNINYYKLAGYWWSMQSDKESHTFKKGSKFKDVINIYHFDRELRIIVFKAIDFIETSFRTQLIYQLSLSRSPWWFEDESLFANNDYYLENLSKIDTELRRSKEIFITEHHKKYFDDNRRPPSWKTLEITPLGNLSKIYSNLIPSLIEKNKIARFFEIANHTYFNNWIMGISQIRNLCAHHMRLWNKNLPTLFKFMPKPKGAWIVDVPPIEERRKIYSALCCIKYMLNSINKSKDITSDIENIFSTYTNIDPKAMGFKQGWNDEPLWKH
jgi:abortive infection bacteriophage resistance protein